MQNETSLFDNFIDTISRHIIDPLITVLAVCAFAYFVWGVVMFILNADKDDKRKEGKMHMLYGLIGLAIIFGAMGIVSFLRGIVTGG